MSGRTAGCGVRSSGWPWFWSWRSPQARIAIVQSRRAGQQRTKAQVAAAAASAAQQTAQDAADTANVAQRTAQDAASTATAAQRATAIDNLISESILLRSSRQDVAALLAVEAYRLDPVAAKSALFATFTHNVGFEGYRSVEGTSSVLAVAPLPTANRALGLLDNGRLVELDVATGTVVRDLATLATSATPLAARSLLRLSADGSTVVVALQDERVMTWRAYDVDSGDPLGPAVEVPFQPADVPHAPLAFGGFGDAALDRTGARLAVGGAGGQVLVFDTTDGTVVGRLSVPVPDGWSIPGRTASVLFGPDGTLYVGSVAGDLLLVDPVPVDGQLRTVGNIADAPWSADSGLRLGTDADGSDYLITFGSGAVSRVDLSTAKLRWSRLNGSENPAVMLATGSSVPGLQPCDDIAIASAIGRFYCTDDFGTLAEQDVATGELTSRQFDRQSGGTAALAISFDGTHLLAPSFTSNALASWRLDGGGPIQRVLAGHPSFATYGYDSTDTYLESQETLGIPHIWNATTGQPLADPTEFYIGTWAVAPHQLWVAWVATGATTGGLYDVVSASRVPGPEIGFESGPAPIPSNDAAHGRMLARWPDHVAVFDQTGNRVGPTITGSGLPEHYINAVWSTVDGTKIGVSAFGDGTSLYDATTGERIAVPSLPFINTVVSPNGIGVGSTVDGRLYTFDPDTLQILDQLPGLARPRGQPLLSATTGPC